MQFGRSVRFRALALIGIATLAVGCKKDDPAADEEAEGPTAVSVRTIVVTAQPYTETVGALGVVAARAGHIASLSAPAPARIAQVLVSKGQRVGVGTRLVVFEQTPFIAALNAAEAALNTAQRAYDRAKTLADAGIIPRKDFESASSDLAKSRNEMSLARRAAQLSVLRSPISGVVTEMAAVLGASADVNQPLVEIADPTELDIVLGTTPALAGRVRPGNNVQLRAGQNASGESLGVGIVKDVAAEVDSTARNVEIRASLPTASRPLRIGETVYGDIEVGTRANSIAIPIEAIIPDGDQFKVFVVDAKNIAHARAVTVGAKDTREAEILKGVSPGERVVTFGAYGLDDGVTVVLAKQ
ncbi:MAG: efflux RND transporter periplasmic adaptor subunit [Gemmatimonadaceae bacterium]